MICPLIVALVSGFFISVLIRFAILWFAKILSDTGQATFLPTQIVLSFSQFVREYW